MNWLLRMKLRLQILQCRILDVLLVILVVFVGASAAALSLVEAFSRVLCRSLGLSERWVNPLTNSLAFTIGALMLFYVILDIAQVTL
jgi:hypothetical protein